MTNTDSPLDEIMLALQKETGEAWERYEGAEYDELDEYGDAYDNAFHKAEQAIELYCHKQVIEARKKTASDIFNLAHQYASEDETMKGSEELRSYHYYNAIAKIGEFDGR